MRSEEDSKALLRVTCISLDALNRPRYIKRIKRMSRDMDHVMTSVTTFDALIGHLANQYQVHQEWTLEGQPTSTQFFICVPAGNQLIEKFREIFDRFLEIETVDVIAIEILPHHMGEIFIG